MRFRALGLFVLTLCGGLGCAESAYRRASREDSLEAWRAFVEGNPKDPNLDLGKTRLEELEYKAAEDAHTTVAYKRFLEAFPDSSHARAVKLRLEGLRFNAAAREATLEGWARFLREHPDGAHREEAERAFRALELKAIPHSNDLQSLQRIAQGHPDEQAGVEASKKIDDLSFAEAKSAESLYSYLLRFPAGTHRDEAKAALLSRQLEGLLISGLMTDARALATKNAPLVALVPRFDQRMSEAEQFWKVRSTLDRETAALLRTHSLRDIETLVAALRAPDALDRWDAAEELGWHVSVQVIDPLLDVMQNARSIGVRLRALESLRSVLKALPAEVSEYEIATRLERLRDHASDAPLIRTAAILRDVNGQPDVAAQEYQRSWDSNLPDPMVLRRWVTIRLERKQWFSAAVAARQLSVWVQQTLGDAPAITEANALSVAREWCTLFELIGVSVDALERVGAQQNDSPEDVKNFLASAKSVQQLAKAKLRDAELAMVEHKAAMRSCSDAGARARLEAVDVERRKALETSKAKLTPERKIVLQWLSAHDPSEKIQSLAAAKLR